MLVWMSEAPLVPGRVRPPNGAHRTLRCARFTIVSTSTPSITSRPANWRSTTLPGCRWFRSELLFDRYDDNRQTGAFILIDRLSNATVGAGMITGAGSAWDRTPEDSLQRQASNVSGAERAIRFGQQPGTVLLTGLTAAGKSTIAMALERELFDRGKVAVRLDGENLRLGISRDLGFTGTDRSENLRRAAEIARLLNNQGLTTVAAFVAPDAEVRRRFGVDRDDRYLEVFLDTPIDVCRDRDTSGLYERADAGEIADFPGVSAPYDREPTYDLRLDPSALSVKEAWTPSSRRLPIEGSFVGDQPVSKNIVRARATSAARIERDCMGTAPARCGSPAFPGRGSRRWHLRSNAPSSIEAWRVTCWTVTTSALDSTTIWAFRQRTAPRTSAALERCAGFSRTLVSWC